MFDANDFRDRLQNPMESVHFADRNPFLNVHKFRLLTKLDYFSI